MRSALTVGSLFSGIGGFDLGLERAGMRVIWQSEIDPYASAVLRKHWPDVPNLGDVRGITANRISNLAIADHLGLREWFPDVICGGFPCQDISNAGKRAGIDGERSGLWSEYARVIGELRPRYVLVENVSALLGRGLERVLGDLAALGFDAEWHCIPASAVGAPHRRDRVWIVAHARCECGERRRCECRGSEAAGARDRAARSSQHAVDVADAISVRELQPQGREQDEWGRASDHRQAANEGWALDDAMRGRHRAPQVRLPAGRHGTELASWWISEPDVGRVAHGVPSRVDRLRCLGNAIVPQVAEVIGRAIVASH